MLRRIVWQSVLILSSRVRERTLGTSLSIAVQKHDIFEIMAGVVSCKVRYLEFCSFYLPFCSLFLYYNNLFLQWKVTCRLLQEEGGVFRTLIIKGFNATDITLTLTNSVQEQKAVYIFEPGKGWELNCWAFINVFNDCQTRQENWNDHHCQLFYVLPGPQWNYL